MRSAIFDATQLLLGTSTSDRPDAAAREEAARVSWVDLPATRVLNLRFYDEAAADGPVPRMAWLRSDARTMSGAAGARKPIVSEMLDVLAAEAGRQQIPRIGIVNADIAIDRAAFPGLLARDEPALAVSRIDRGGGQPEAVQIFGLDLFIFDAAFWRRERRRFRPYILGELTWDNVYASVAACHGGAILNRGSLILHERHPAATANSPYRRYLHLLAARDRGYFRRWCEYVAHLQDLRARGGTSAEEDALQRRTFQPPRIGEELLDAGRKLWWQVRGAIPHARNQA